MATVVTIMDKPSWKARTDNIVVADPSRHMLLWVPRDLWSPEVGNRINRAFADGGHELLRRALQRWGIDAQHGVSLRRESVELALAGATVTVPVPFPMRLSYPLHPHRPIEEGRVRITFTPPSEVLSGERIHQWVGARYGVGIAASDFGRIARQQILVRALLRDGFDFGLVLEEPDWVRVSSPAALDELRQVRADWHFDSFSDVVGARKGNRRVLIPRIDMPDSDDTDGSAPGRD